jgi:hypothetical protein
MKRLVFALCCAVLAFAGCASRDGDGNAVEPERVELGPGYFDPK